MEVEEASYGIIPLKKEGEVWKVLLILHKGGKHWAFPKGRIDPGEEPLETAVRELKEETGLEVVEFVSREPLSDRYRFRRSGLMVTKSVDYFPAVVAGVVKLQPEEIEDSKWVILKEAGAHLTFHGAKKICRSVIELLEEKGGD